MKFTPEMVKAASQMMSKMSPEELSSMTRLASGMHTPSAPSPSGSWQSAPGLLAGGMPDDPESIKSMARMLQNMDESTLAEMCMSTGMAKTKAQADDIASKMKQMTPGQVRSEPGCIIDTKNVAWLC